jgi:hypothetical protein
MRKLIATVLAALAVLVAGPVVAADFPDYPPIIEIPDVDYGVEGSFYLRGSAGLNLLWAKEAVEACGSCVFPIDHTGFGYSVGAGFGYETGTGLRFDATLDWLGNSGLHLTKNTGNPDIDGEYSLNLRTTLALANIYYDFSLSGHDGYGEEGGMFAYVGAGAGLAYNMTSVDSPATAPISDGANASFAAAGMLGLGYDFGDVVADVGYRGIYINQITNMPSTTGYYIDNPFIHEVRGTVRYRFN